MDKKKILVGEDSSVIQNLTKKILSSQNYAIFSAKNGEEVLSMMKKEEYNLILLDINMPKMNGMDCARAIRDLENSNKTIPIIAITGNAAGYTEQDFKEAGFTHYILKPLDFDSLVEVVKKNLEDF